MTTPTAAPGPGVHTGSFGGYPFPAEVVARIINLLISGAVFAPSLTRQGTVRSTVAWPTAKPTGWAWLEELQPFPTIDVDDDAYVVAVAKLGGIVDLSNEGFTDASINMSAQLGDLLRDSLSRDLDIGLLTGGGPPAPVGVVGVAPEVEAADLHAAVTTARGQIGDQGGTANTLAALPSVLAAADAQRSEGDTGVLVYPNGFAASLGLRAVGVPGITAPLVYDATRCFFGGPRRRHGGRQPRLALRPGRLLDPRQGPDRRRDPRRAQGHPQAEGDPGRVGHPHRQGVTAGPPWLAWAPPLDPPTAGGLPSARPRPSPRPAGLTTRTWPPS